MCLFINNEEGGKKREKLEWKNMSIKQGEGEKDGKKES